MPKHYKNARIEEQVLEELKKIKRLYEMQNNKDYSTSEIISFLIEERKKKQFVLPDLKKT